MAQTQEAEIDKGELTGSEAEFDRTFQCPLEWSDRRYKSTKEVFNFHRRRQ